MQTTKITTFQFLVLVTFFSIGTSILVLPSTLAIGAKQDAWISAIIGTVVGVFIVWLYTKIALWFPNLNYTQLNEKIFGKWIGKLTSLVLIITTILYTAALLTYGGFFLNTEMLPATPLPIISILNCLVLIISVRLGFDTFARAAEIFIFVFFFLFILLVIFLIPKIDIGNLEPFFYTSFTTVSKSSLQLIADSSLNSIVLLMIFPTLIHNTKNAIKSFLLGKIIGGVVLIVITGLCIFVLGSHETASKVYPSYVLAKQVSIGGFVNRIEGSMAALWVLALFIKTGLYFYVSLIGLAQIFGLKDYKAIVLPLSAAVMGLSITMFPNIIDQQKFDRTTSVSLSIIIGLFIPMLLSVVYLFRRKKLQQEKEV